MALSGVASFRGYVATSLVMTAAVIFHAVYAKRFFYRAVVYLSSSKFAILAAGNMGLVSFLLAWRLIQAVFLGPLRFREVERLHLRARDAIIECCFALTVFREEFNARFLALVTLLLLVKSLHWLCKDRIEYMEEQPLTPRCGHLRLICMMGVLFAIDARLVTTCLLHTVRASGATMFVLFVFEFTVLLIELVSTMVRYILHVIDLYMDSRWDGKGLYSFYNELLADLCQLTVYVAFFAYVQFFYTFPLHIIRDLYLTFTKFQKRCADFMRYRRVVATMNELFADATEEELAEGDRTCIICREEMRAAKKLNCGHMFHVRCLQSWLKRQLSCPTCRSAVDVSESAPRAGAAQGGEHGAGAARAGEAGAGIANAAAPANAANNGLPPWAAVGAQGAPGPAGPRGPAPGPGGRPGDGGAMRIINAWWQTLMAAIAPQNAQQPRQMPPLGPRYAQVQNRYGIMRVQRHAPRHMGPPGLAPHGHLPQMHPPHAHAHPPHAHAHPPHAHAHPPHAHGHPPHAHAHPPHAHVHPQHVRGHAPVHPNAPSAQSLPQGLPPLSPNATNQHPATHPHSPHHHHRHQSPSLRHHQHHPPPLQYQLHPGNAAHPAFPLHQLYQNHPEAVLQRRIFVGVAAPGQVAGQNGNVPGAAASPAGGEATQEGAGPPQPLRPVDMMYRASLERILHLHEALGVIGLQLDAVQPAVASLREELRVALLAATAPEPNQNPEAEPSLPTDAPSDASDAPVPPSVPASEPQMQPRTEARDGAASTNESKDEPAASSSGVGSLQQDDSSRSEADQLRQRRLQFLDRNASRGSSSSANDDNARSGNQEP